MPKEIKRIVSTSFWEDLKVVNDFSPEDKYFMLYLLTNPHTSQLGIYGLVPKVAAFELGYSVEAVMVLLDRFENKYGILKYSRETSEVAIKNFLKYSVVKGGKPVMDCLLRDESQVKDKSLLTYIHDSINDTGTLNNTVKEYLIHVNNNNDNENENERIVNESSKARRSSVFKPPTLQDVSNYVTEKGLTYVNPESFVDFYDSKNWMVGKNKMTNWRSAASGWNRRAKERGEREYARNDSPVGASARSWET